MCLRHFLVNYLCNRAQQGGFIIVKVSKKSKFKGPWPFSLLVFLLNPKVWLRLKKLVVCANLRHFIMMLSIAAVFIVIYFIAPFLVEQSYFATLFTTLWSMTLVIGIAVIPFSWMVGTVACCLQNPLAYNLRAINAYRFSVKTAKFNCHVTVRESGLGLRCKIRKDRHWKCKQMSLRKRSCLRKRTAFVAACYFCPWLSFVIAKLMQFIGVGPLHSRNSFILITFVTVVFCYLVIIFEISTWFYLEHVWNSHAIDEHNLKHCAYNPMTPVCCAMVISVILHCMIRLILYLVLGIS